MMKVRRAWKHKFYPTKAQEIALITHLRECARLYNAGIQERTEAWKYQRKSISWYEQKRELTEIRAAGDTGIVNCGVGQNVLKRVDLAFQAFFRRCKAGETPGYPKYRASALYDSFTYSWGNGCCFKSARLYAQGIGNLRIRVDRPIQGRIKTLTLKREAQQWYAVFSCEVEIEPMPQSDNAIGIDVGLKSFVSLSTGEIVNNPRFTANTERALRVAQRKLERRTKNSRGWREAKSQIQKLHAKLKNQRREFQHALSRRLINENGLIAIEDLNVKGLCRGMLAKSVNDASWASFNFQLQYKAEAAGRALVKVDPRGTSQTCICGVSVPKTLGTRIHDCSECGARVDRDVMSAIVILHRALNRKR